MIWFEIVAFIIIIHFFISSFPMDCNGLAVNVPIKSCVCLHSFSFGLEQSWIVAV